MAKALAEALVKRAQAAGKKITKVVKKRAQDCPRRKAKAEKARQCLIRDAGST